MKTEMNKKRFLIIMVIGLFCVSSGTMLNHFGRIGDGFTGFITGIGLGLEIFALIIAKKQKKGNLKCV